LITSCHPFSLVPSNNVVFIAHAVLSVYVVSHAGIHIYLSLGLFSGFYLASGDTQHSIFSCRTYLPDNFSISFLILLLSQLASHLGTLLKEFRRLPQHLRSRFSRLFGLWLCFRLTTFVLGSRSSVSSCALDPCLRSLPRPVPSLSTPAYAFAPSLCLRSLSACDFDSLCGLWTRR
jgi:hypothetical protein